MPNIEDREEAALRLIVEQVIARTGTATFLLSRKQERSPLIRSLVDLRLMHCVQRGVRPYRHDPANRYNVYALDYGVYAISWAPTAPRRCSCTCMATRSRSSCLTSS